MSRPAKTIFTFGVYIILISSILMVAPNVLLGVFGIGRTDEVWIRFVGAIGMALGFYYLVAARHELAPFFRASIPGRVGFLVACVAFASLRLADPMVVVFGIVDVLGATWTLWALKHAGSAGT